MRPGGGARGMGAKYPLSGAEVTRCTGSGVRRGPTAPTRSTVQHRPPPSAAPSVSASASRCRARCWRPGPRPRSPPRRLVKGGSLGGMYKVAMHGSSHPPGGGSDEGLVGGVGGRGGVKGDESDVTRCGRGLVLQLGLRCPRHGGGRSPVRSAWERWWGRMIGSVRVEALDPGAVQVLDAPVVCVGASGAVVRSRKTWSMQHPNKQTTPPPPWPTLTRKGSRSSHAGSPSRGTAPEQLSVLWLSGSLFIMRMRRPSHL